MAIDFDWSKPAERQTVPARFPFQSQELELAGHSRDIISIKNLPDISTMGFPQLEIEDHDDVTVQKGDNLWKITSKLLSSKLDRTPTNSEIANGVHEFAQLNALKDPNKLHPGQTLKIPDDLRTTQDPQTAWNPFENLTTQHLTVDNAVQPPSGDTLNIPGLAGNNDGVKHQEVSRLTNFNGVTHVESTGALDDGILFGIDRTTFRSETNTDGNGNLISGRTTYDTSWGAPSIKVPDGHGDSVTMHASSVETHRNSSGNYDTVISDLNGQRYNVVTDVAGYVIGE